MPHKPVLSSAELAARLRTAILQVDALGLYPPLLDDCAWMPGLPPLNKSLATHPAAWAEGSLFLHAATRVACEAVIAARREKQPWSEAEVVQALQGAFESVPQLGQRELLARTAASLGLRLCAAAGCVADAGHSCAGCRRTHYCSQPCQKRAWKKHKPVCRGAWAWSWAPEEEEVWGRVISLRYGLTNLDRALHEALRAMDREAEAEEEEGYGTIGGPTLARTSFLLHDDWWKLAMQRRVGVAPPPSLPEGFPSREALTRAAGGAGAREG